MTPAQTHPIVRHWYTPALSATRCGKDASKWFSARLTRNVGDVTCEPCGDLLTGDNLHVVDGTFPSRFAVRRANREARKEATP